MLNMKWTMSAVMLAAALATTASAQTPEHYRGNFTLPFEARFGTTVLPAGNYSVTTLEGAKGIRISGERGDVSILAAGSDFKKNDHAKFILVDSAGMYTLQSFASGAMGQELHFLVAKNKRGTTERAAVVKPTIEVGMQ